MVFDKVTNSGRQGVFFDTIDQRYFLNYVYEIIYPTTCTLESNDREAVVKYKIEILQYVKEHNLISRV